MIENTYLNPFVATNQSPTRNKIFMGKKAFKLVAHRLGKADSGNSFVIDKVAFIEHDLLEPNKVLTLDGALADMLRDFEAEINNAPKMEGCTLQASRVDPHCSCLEEEWDTPVGCAFLHIKPNGEGEAFFDNGIQTWEVEFTANDEQSFRNKLSDYIHNLPVIDD